jgi:hypothetical protein
MSPLAIAKRGVRFSTVVGEWEASKEEGMWRRAGASLRHSILRRRRVVDARWCRVWRRLRRGRGGVVGRRRRVHGGRGSLFRGGEAARGAGRLGAGRLV